LTSPRDDSFGTRNLNFAIPRILIALFVSFLIGVTLNRRKTAPYLILSITTNDNVVQNIFLENQQDERALIFDSKNLKHSFDSARHKIEVRGMGRIVSGTNVIEITENISVNPPEERKELRA